MSMTSDDTEWLTDCVLVLRMLDGQVQPISDEELVTAIVDTYRRTQRPEWAQVNIENLTAEHEELRASYILLEHEWVKDRRTIRELTDQRDRARRIAVALEQEQAR